MKLGSLFSGGGLGDFGFMAAGMEIAWQCEIDEYCQKILTLRYPESKKYRDIKTLKGEELEQVDIITGGFPCQPFSVAGQQMGKSDDRHLWPEMFRIIQEVNPSWVVGENVPGFINMALDDVCANLESAGYEVGTIVFPAHALGAKHRRERVWIIAKSSSKRCNDRRNNRQKRQVLQNENWNATKDKSERERRECGISEIGTNVADTECFRQQGQGEYGQSMYKETHRKGKADWLIDGCKTWERYWEFEPTVGRVANGIANRVHRLKMLGNGQVPACTYVIGNMIMDIEKGLI